MVLGLQLVIQNWGDVKKMLDNTGIRCGNQLFFSDKIGTL